MKPSQPIPFDLQSNEPGSFQTDNAQVALEWCAVLASQKIDFELSREGDEWQFSISPANFANAEKNITEYESERGLFDRQIQEIDTPPKPLELANSLPFVICSLFLLLFYGITGPVSMKSHFFDQGILNPKAVYKQGEWWRAITALTLHADLPHVLGNCIFLTIFATIAGMKIGPGLAVFMILLTGVLGNCSNLVLFGASSYSSLGASTAVFGALGIISMLSMLNRKKDIKFKKWVPLAAGAAILAFTGSSSGSDLAAHLFGFLWGVGAGAVLSRFQGEKNNFYLQGIFYIAAFALVYFAWNQALN